ncbi:hypothetical protein, partial [Neisseria meningitidis]|uniref:hypothetical protein n=1 Tax=Neisseria meningitidis TaxID=487 RepID=UPI001E3B1E99
MTFSQKNGFVIPAQAGIQPRRYGNVIGKTVSLDFAFWIPTFVGMTGCRFPLWIASSFPRRRESSLVGTEIYRENGFL